MPLPKGYIFILISHVVHITKLPYATRLQSLPMREGHCPSPTIGLYDKLLSLHTIPIYIIISKLSQKVNRMFLQKFGNTV